MFDANGLSKKAANAIYDVLVKHAGEIEGDWSRDEFISAQTREFCPEYRFQGGLGFGGKFWRDHDKWSVNGYSEDQTPASKKMIAETNQALAELYKQFN